MSGQNIIVFFRPLSLPFIGHWFPIIDYMGEFITDIPCHLQGRRRITMGPRTDAGQSASHPAPMNKSSVRLNIKMVIPWNEISNRVQPKIITNHRICESKAKNERLGKHWKWVHVVINSNHIKYHPCPWHTTQPAASVNGLCRDIQQNRHSPSTPTYSLKMQSSTFHGLFRARRRNVMNI